MTRITSARLARMALWYRSQGDTDAANRAEEVLARLGRCRRCGRALTDPASVERGVGPDCVKKGDPDV